MIRWVLLFKEILDPLLDNVLQTQYLFEMYQVQTETILFFNMSFFVKILAGKIQSLSLIVACTRQLGDVWL